MEAVLPIHNRSWIDDSMKLAAAFKVSAVECFCPPLLFDGLTFLSSQSSPSKQTRVRQAGDYQSATAGSRGISLRSETVRGNCGMPPKT